MRALSRAPPFSLRRATFLLDGSLQRTARVVARRPSCAGGGCQIAPRLRRRARRRPPEGRGLLAVLAPERAGLASFGSSFCMQLLKRGGESSLAPTFGVDRGTTGDCAGKGPFNSLWLPEEPLNWILVLFSPLVPTQLFKIFAIKPLMRIGVPFQLGGGGVDQLSRSYM